MIHTTERHHEAGLPLLVPLATAITIAACWIRMKLDERKEKTKDENED